MRHLSVIFLSFVLFSELLFCQIFEAGKRAHDSYRLWIYFDKRDPNNLINLDNAAIKRRKKHNIYIPTKYDYHINESYIKKVEKLGVVIKNKSRWLNAISVIANREQIKKIQKLSFVIDVQPVMLYKKSQNIKTSNSNELNRDFDYGSSLTQINNINCRTAHNAGYYGQGVRVLYIDTGFNLSHSAFDSINVIAQYDFINSDLNTANETTQEFNDNQDDHGTTCLSVIGGFAEGNLIGSAFKSEYLLAKTEIVAEEIQQEEDNYVAALEWGESLGADIACASLGYYDWYDYNNLDGNTATTTIAVDIASSLGVLCVNSAGNSGNDSWYYIITPADADSVLSVGAVSSNGSIASFSSHGPTSDGRVKPEVCAMGVNVYCVRSDTQNNYRTSSGTSFSAPLVGGAAAVILSANSNWTNMEVREALMMTASQNNNPDNSYGYGIIDTWAAINFQFLAKTYSEKIVPNSITVSKAYPNPFNPLVSLFIESNIDKYFITSAIYDINGKFIESIFDGISDSEKMNLKWDASSYPAGVYIIHTNWIDGSHFQKITLLK